jgi:tRNA threonylcarbamoyl adenosine modification protein YeaZ
VPCTLAIETSNPSAWEPSQPLRPGVAIIDHHGTTHVEEIDPTRVHDDDLLPAIDRLTRRASLTPRDITHIAVSAGPGGFTAVRMATTIAKTIADVTGAQCIPVPTAHSVAAAMLGHGRAPSQLTDERKVQLTGQSAVQFAGQFAVALASKGDTAWLATFDALGNPTGPAAIATAGDLAARSIRMLVADRFLPQPFLAAASAHNIHILRPIFDPVACAHASRSIAPVAPAHLLPIYPRPPEAVRKWKELHGDHPPSSTRTQPPPAHTA